MLYATLTALKSYLGLTDSQTKDDARLTFFLQSASSFIENIRRCDVRREARKLNCPSLNYQRAAFGAYSVQAWVTAMSTFNELAAQRLRLDDDLLSIEGVTNGDGTALLATEYEAFPPNNTPKASLSLVPSSGKSWLPKNGTDFRQAITVDGWWGWHKKYDYAWVDSLDTIQSDPLAVNGTTLIVTEPTGVAGDLRADRFQVGTLIRIEDELCYVVGRDTEAGTLTIARSFNGTTAVAHDKNTKIYLWRFDAQIELAAIRLATWRYRQKDSNTFDKTTILATGEQIVPSSIPPDVRDLLPQQRPTYKDVTM